MNYTKYIILARIRYRKLKHIIRRRLFFGNILKLWDRVPGYARAMGALLVVFVVVAAGWAINYRAASAQTISLTAQDYLAGTSKYGSIKIGQDDASIQLQNGLVGAWDSATDTGLQQPPVLSRGINNLEYGPNDTLYSLMSVVGQCSFDRYDIERQSWTALSTPPIACGTGTVLKFDGKSSFYYAPGGSSSSPSNRFFRYDIKSDDWVELAKFPSVISNISDGIYVKQGAQEYIYLFPGMGSSIFWRYSIIDNSWESISPFPTSSNVDSGIAVAWDGQDTIYALANVTGEYKKYDVVTNIWSALPSYTDNGLTSRYQLKYLNGKIYATKLEWYANRLGLRSYDIINQAWVTLSAPPSPANVYDEPLALTSDGERYLYTYIGYDIRPLLYRYDTHSNTWNNASLFRPDQSDSDIHYRTIYDGGQSMYFYGGRGSFDRVYKYDLASRQSTQIGAQLSAAVGFGGVYYNGGLYTLPRDNSRDFKRYDVATNNFVDLADLPVTARSSGMDIIEGGDGYLYAVFGGNQSQFYRYNISLNSWQQLGSVPAVVGAGGGLSRIGRKIYVLSGANSGAFQVYDMDAAQWTAKNNLPSGGVDYGAFITSDTSRFLYVGLSNRTISTTRIVYRYDTVGDIWRRIADLPASALPYSSAFYDTANNKLYVSQGSISSLIWEWSPLATAYVTNGTWYSNTYDLKQVKNWTSLDFTKSGGGSVIIETRTSNNGNIWSDWQPIVGNSIMSPKNRYIQLKVSLSGDGSVSPKVENISIHHTQESDAPTMPSQFLAQDKKDGASLSTGQTYEHQHPYFSWSGADDGLDGSGVDGYYVYFGTDSTADPAVSGSYQEESNYVVTTPMTAGEVYYVRLKVRDKLGNTTSAATYFSYRYFYISPPGSVIKTSSTDFSEGLNTNVSINDGSMQLERKAHGAWSTGALVMPPDITRGATQAIVENYLYVARGSGSADFWRYDLDNQRWDMLSPVPAGVSSGSSMVSDKTGRLYLLAGNNTNMFFSYNIDQNSWETLPNLPTIAQQGSDIVYVGDNNFLILFTGSRAFYMFNSDSGIYTFKQLYPTSINRGGSGLWYDGEDTVYAYFGYWTCCNFSGSSRDSMAKYSISNDSWRPLATPPVLANNTQNNLVSDGRGGLYVFTHNQMNNVDKRSRALRYDINLDRWSEVEGLNEQVFTGTVVSDEKRYLYILPGGNNTNTRRMVRYDTWLNKFIPAIASIDVMERVPYDTEINSWQWIAGNATSAAYDGNKYTYAIGGSESTSSWSRFVKFDHQSGETIYLQPPPLIGVSGSMAYVSGKLYYMPGRSTRNFYRYDENSGSWVSMADVPSSVYRPGSSSLTTVGGSLYTALGNGSLFYKYTPDTNGGIWQQMANAPGFIVNGSTVYDDVDNVIYVIAGNNTGTFYRYDVASNSWSTPASLPASTSYGSAMTINGRKIYTQRGNMSKDSYVYDIDTDSWSTSDMAPEIFRYGSRMLKISDSYAIVFSGESSSDIWKFVFPSENHAYNGQAIHTSRPIVTAGIFDYAGIALEANIPSGTSVEVWTRTSVDGESWNEWEIAEDVKKYGSGLSARVTSAPQGHTQIKLILQSDDNVSTPTVHSYALQYYYDVDPPTNPNVIAVYSDSSKSQQLNNNTWYNHARPLIDWPDPGQPGGATDGVLGSRIAGYWVYVGTDETASPRTQGIFVQDTQYEANLTISGNYYVRMQSQDVTGNVDGNIYASFIYKFDNQPPINPSLVAVTPSGFTTTNNFTFEWPNAYDANSGVAGYCYHTGATSGPFADEICQDGKILEDVSAAYRSGTNVFYVRAYDKAGNYSPYYTSTSYYYSTDPPGPATNLRAIPPTSTQNMFAFAWELPVLFAGDLNQLEYCYSINILPSPLNTTCTKDKFISAFKAATQQGTNVIYLVTKDEAGNVNWNDYAYANFIANTVSPGIPLNLVVTDSSDRVSNRWSLTATWDAPTFVGNGINAYVVERSDDGRNFVGIGNTSTRAFVDLDVQPASTYYYRVRAKDNVDNTGGASGVVARAAQGSFAEPPQIVVQPNVSAGFDQTRITWATSRESTSFVYYGTSPSDLSQSKGSLELLTNHTQVITGLLPSSTYYYRVQSFDNSRSYDLNEAYSPIYSFRTTEAARIFDVAVSDITTTSGLVSWKTSVPTKAKIEYGTTLNYGMVYDNQGSGYSTQHSVKLTGLASGAPHHLRIVSTTEFGSSIGSDDYVFETISKPVIDTIRFQPIDDETSSAVRVSWKTNVPTSSTVRYSAYGEKLESTLSELTMEHEIVLKGLASNTEYEIVTEGRDSYGNFVSSAIQKWQSQLDTRAPAISDTSLSVTITEATRDRRAQLIAAWKTDEPATSQLYYGKITDKTLDKKTPLDTEPTTNHVVILSDLNLADIYKIQIVTRDLNGNTMYGPTTTIVTPDNEVNVFDNILNLMLRIFRF